MRITAPAQPKAEDSPLVTIGIPTYNRADWLDRAIASALAQDYAHLEVVISDNASTDRSAEICEYWRVADRRVRSYRQSSNLGPSANFAFVLQQASGTWFMWLGDDDWIDSNYVSQCLKAAWRDQDVALVGGRARYYNAGVCIAQGQAMDLTQSEWWRRVIAYFWRVRDNGIFYGLARTEDQRRSTIRNVMGGDWLHIAALGARGQVLTIETTTVHREVGGATTSYRNIARSLSLHPLIGRFPFTAIAIQAFADVAWRHPGYRGGGASTRWAIAALVAGGVILRGLWGALFSAARSMRSALRR